MASPFDAAFSDPEGPEANPTRQDFTLPDVDVTSETNTAGRGGTTDPGTGDAVAPLVSGRGLEAFDLAGSPAKPAPGGTQEASNYAKETGALGTPEQAAQNLVQMTAPGGQPYTVHRKAAEAFDSFLQDLDKTGYHIHSIGGYNNRNIRGGTQASEHAYGNAIDINPAQNAMGQTGTDLPPNIEELAAKNNLEAGRHFSRPDPMHFEYDPRGMEGNRSTMIAAGQDAGPSGNNPGNIRFPAGTKNPDTGAPLSGFQRFPTMEAGINAIGKKLDQYTVASPVTGKPLNTVADIVSTWSPRSDNNDTQRLIKQAAAHLGVDPNAPLNMADPAIRRKMVEATMINEGNFPKDTSVIDRALNPQYAQAGGTTATDAGGAPTPVNFQSIADKFNDPEIDHPAHQPLPPGTSSGAVHGSPGSYANLVKKMNDVDSVVDRPGSPPPTPGIMHQLGHAASYLPAMAFRTAAAAAGWRADALNAITTGQEWAMRKVGLNPKPAPQLGETPDEMNQRLAYGAQEQERGKKFTPEATAAGMDTRPQGPGDVMGPEVPAPGTGQSTLGKVGNILRSPTTENFASLGGLITPPKLPSEVGDTDSISRYLETFGMPALQVAALGMPKATLAAREAGGGAATVAKTIGKSTAGNAALGAGIFGLGDDLGQHISGSPGGTPEAQSWGSGVSMGMEAARLALFKGGSLAAGASPGIFDKYIRGKVGPGPNLRENIADADMAGANLRAHDPNTLVPGFATTGAAASGDNGAQALFNMHRHTSAQVEGRFNDILRNNSNAIDNASEGVIPGAGGVPQHAVDYFRSELEGDQEAMRQRVNDAGLEAKTRFDTVIRDTGVGEDHVLAREALGNSQHDALWEADKNLKSHADWRWDNARKAGIMELPIADTDAATTLHGPLQAAMAEAIRSGQGEHFPFNAVKGLYKGDPRALFDGEGNLAATKQSSNVIARIGPDNKPVFEGGGPQTNPKNGLTIGQVREIQSDLEAEVRQERKAVTSPFVQGDPKALRWQSRVLGVLNDAMDHTLENSGGGNNATYRLATAATANRYKLTNQGVVGQILGRNLQGGDGSIASPQTLEKLVPGGTGGAASTRQLFDVIESQRNQQAGLDPHTGQPAPGAPIGQPAPPSLHPADILHQNLENQLRLDFGQHMRDGGPEHGQQWLENHSVALDAFPGLKADMQNAVSSGADYKGLQKQQTQYDKQQGHDAASLFLNGDAGKEIDYITRSGKPVEAMNGALDRGAGDHTGRANPAIARMFFDRMRTEAVDPITHDYIPGGVAKFWDAHKDTFGALADRGLINRQALGQIVSSFKELDKMHANPGATLTMPESAKISLPYLADKAFRVAGATIGREAHSGTIQVPGITADIASKIGGQLFGKLSASGAKNLQADLLFEPGRLQQFLEAGTAATQGKGTALMEKLLSPYMRAAPAIAAAQASKQIGPQTQPDANGNVAPHSTNSGLGRVSNFLPW